MAAANEQRFVFVAEDRTKRATEQVKKGLRDTDAQGRRTSNSFRQFRGASQQLGFQIQDVAVQLQGGTSAAQVFGQQGSQIASIFGPGGAVIGALIAVGAALGGTFLSSLTQSNELLKKLRENAKDSAEDILSLSGAQRELALQALRKQLTDTTTELRAEEEKLGKAQRDAALPVKGINDRNAAARERGKKSAKELSLNVGLLTQEQTRLNELIKASIDPQFAAARAAEENDVKVRASNASLIEQIATYGKSAEALATYKAVLDGTITAEERNNIALAANLDKLNERKRQEQEDAKREKEAAKQKERNSKAVVSNLDNQLEASARTSRSMFELNKAVNIAQAIMDTRASATLALKTFPPPFGQIAAAANIAFGLQQVAAIKSTSFEGGGFTGMGARSGGIDGRGGFLATLHPNESVIDHTKGQGAGVTIINNVDARGSSADVDQKIRVAMQQTSQQTVMTIQDLMRRRRFV
tara:strand:+ start:2512 stop:3924 length:1413 start_codon:yes stop_codon:yes gene_type:complete